MTRKPEGGDGDAEHGALAPVEVIDAEEVVSVDSPSSPVVVMTGTATEVADNELMFEIDGPGVHPSTIDTLGMLRMAASLFSLVAVESEHLGAKLNFGGIVIRAKCAAIACAVDDRVAGRRAMERALQVIRGEATAAPKGNGHAKSFKAAAARFDEHKTFRARAGDAWSAPIDIRRRSSLPAPPTVAHDDERESWISLRARPLRAGGKRQPEVLFDSELERGDFTLTATEEDVRTLGSMLYKEVDLDAIVRRHNGRIIGGEIQPRSIRPVIDDASDPWIPWVAWYRTVSQE